MTEPAHILTPDRDLLMIRQDPRRDVTSSGLSIPETATEVTPWTGTILDRGPWADPEYAVGRRVCFRPHGGYLVGFEGVGAEERAVRFLSPERVLAFLDASIDPASLQSEDVAQGVHAKRGKILVERVEMPIRRGRIHLPDSARVHVRSTEVLIRSIGADVEGFEVGERRLITHAVGDEIRFGDRGEIRLWQIDPDMTIATVQVEDERLRSYGDDPLRDTEVLSQVDHQETRAYDEGDRRSLR